MPRCWVKNCKEEPFLKVEEIWFDFGKDDNYKFCSSKEVFKNDDFDLYLCYLHYVPEACSLATSILNYSYAKGLVEPLVPERWFLLFESGFLADGYVTLTE